MTFRRPSIMLPAVNPHQKIGDNPLYILGYALSVMVFSVRKPLFYKTAFLIGYALYGIR